VRERDELGSRVAALTALAPEPPVLPPSEPSAGQTEEAWLAEVGAARVRHDAMALLLGSWWRPAQPPTLATSVAYRDVAGLPACVYRPRAEGRRPALLVFHGGGFWMGGGALAFTFLDPLCRRLCLELGALVVNLDYRLAPEHRFPAQRLDGVAALAALRAEAETLAVDPERIGVLGFSSGAHLAASVAQQVRADLRAQALVMPVLDVSSSQPSAQADPVWRETAVRLRQLYFGSDADLTDPAVSPLFEPSLRGVAPAFVLTAEHDPLRDDGRSYARRLSEAGVDVRHAEFPATHVAATDAVQQQMDDALLEALQEML